jgi:hypothetical protein
VKWVNNTRPATFRQRVHRANACSRTGNWCHGQKLEAGLSDAVTSTLAGTWAHAQRKMKMGIRKSHGALGCSPTDVSRNHSGNRRDRQRALAWRKLGMHARDKLNARTKSMSRSHEGNRIDAGSRTLEIEPSIVLSGRALSSIE